ncbi:hypothetical protein HPB50_023646 [Hyalomma asiaticum]|uniref:Uncharacterized protein n=1 Tax=Hyalomma asiaticum TaxID=266040 RepID=A0ACB7T4E2_HYAAI|nr:hypothetical protein HPB50_023646 [Hyalomma asiaticum]
MARTDTPRVSLVCIMPRACVRQIGTLNNSRSTLLRFLEGLAFVKSALPPQGCATGPRTVLVRFSRYGSTRKQTAVSQTVRVSRFALRRILRSVTLKHGATLV